jgi:hypothetical protein
VGTNLKMAILLKSVNAINLIAQLGLRIGIVEGSLNRVITGLVDNNFNFDNKLVIETITIKVDAVVAYNLTKMGQFGVGN